MKIRNGYISNSSSSSFIIACKNEELANKVLEAYNKLVDYWKEIHPNFSTTFFDTNYVKDSAQNIINNFSEYFNFSTEEKKYLLNEWTEKENNGYILLYGTCSNEYDIDGYYLMNMFNEYILNKLSDQYEDIEIIFDRRGS